MQREAEQRAGETPGGLTREDLGKLERAEAERDARAAHERSERRADERRREQERLDQQQPEESVIDSVEAPDARGRIAEAFGGERRPPTVQAGTPAQNRAFLMRMASVGMALLGLFLLWQALQSQTGQVGTPGGPVASATPTAAVSGPITQASPAVSGTATANASFTKVSGPCNLAARFNDRYSFMATNGALTLTQLSNNHVSRGTISPNGEFTTTAEGQGYRGTVSGTMARGQHTYTAQGCNEVYDFTMTFPTAFIGGGGAQQANRPPEAGAIRATQTGTTTNYTVLNVSDPDGDPLRYRWTSTNPCGPPTGAAATFSWPHPHPPCPDEPVHPSNITVQIDDGRFVITRTYTAGSAAGTGSVPLAGVGISTIAPSPTAAPPTATAAAPTATAPAVVAGTSGVNIPLILIALILIIGALGLWFGGPLLAGGPVQEQKKNCDREKAEEERTRREMEAKRAEFDSINQTRRGAEHAESEASKAEAAARASERGTASGEDPVTHERIWGSDARSQAAKRAHETARDARDDANRRRNDYNAQGGDGAWQAKKDASDAATRAHDAAAAALAACLESIAPPPAPPASEPVPGGGGATTAGGGTTTGGAGTGGPVVAGGTPGGTMTRPDPCPNPPWRIVQREPLTIHVADMSTTKISLDADRESYIDLDATLEWAERLRLGGKVANQATRLAPDVRSAMGPMGPLLGFTGTMTDAALNGLRRLGEQLRGHFRGGMYSVTYTRHTYVLRCAVRETCSQGVWTAQPGELTVEETAVTEEYVGGDKGTDPARNLVIGGYGTDIPRQVNDIMIRLFNELAGMNRRAEQAAKAFEQQCRGGQ